MVLGSARKNEQTCSLGSLLFVGMADMAAADGARMETSFGEDGHDACKAVVDILDRIGDKWTVMVVGALADGPDALQRDPAQNRRDLAPHADIDAARWNVMAWSSAEPSRRSRRRSSTS